jgi:hypothetical protein
MRQSPLGNFTNVQQDGHGNMTGAFQLQPSFSSAIGSGQNPGVSRVAAAHLQPHEQGPSPSLLPPEYTSSVGQYSQLGYSRVPEQGHTEQDDGWVMQSPLNDITVNCSRDIYKVVMELDLGDVNDVNMDIDCSDLDSWLNSLATAAEPPMSESDADTVVNNQINQS